MLGGRARGGDDRQGFESRPSDCLDREKWEIGLEGGKGRPPYSVSKATDYFAEPLVAPTK